MPEYCVKMPMLGEDVLNLFRITAEDESKALKLAETKLRNLFLIGKMYYHQWIQQGYVEETVKPNKTMQILSIMRDLRLSLKHLVILRDKTHVNWTVSTQGLWASGRVSDAFDALTILGTIVAEIVQKMRPSGSLPQTIEVPDEVFQFTGPVYVRPIGRGIVLYLDAPGTESCYLCDILSRLFADGDYDMEIAFRALPREKDNHD